MFNAEREFRPVRFCGGHDVTKIEVCQQNSLSLVVQLVTLKVHSVLKETDERELHWLLYVSQ